MTAEPSAEALLDELSPPRAPDAVARARALRAIDRRREAEVTDALRRRVRAIAAGDPGVVTPAAPWLLGAAVRRHDEAIDAALLAVIDRPAAPWLRAQVAFAMVDFADATLAVEGARCAAEGTLRALADRIDLEDRSLAVAAGVARLRVDPAGAYDALTAGLDPAARPQRAVDVLRAAHRVLAADGDPRWLALADRWRTDAPGEVVDAANQFVGARTIARPAPARKARAGREPPWPAGVPRWAVPAAVPWAATGDEALDRLLADVERGASRVRLAAMGAAVDAALDGQLAAALDGLDDLGWDERLVAGLDAPSARRVRRRHAEAWTAADARRQRVYALAALAFARRHGAAEERLLRALAERRDDGVRLAIAVAALGGWVFQGIPQREVGYWRLARDGVLAAVAAMAVTRATWKVHRDWIAGAAAAMRGPDEAG
jgi:hypothetical protein